MSEPLGSDPGQTGARQGSDPRLSVVIASVNGMPYLGRCLDALAEHCPQAEVVVADWTDEATRETVRAGWPSVKLLSFDEPMAIPELRAQGVFAATSPVVALIEDHCLVTPPWGERLAAAHGATASSAGRSATPPPTGSATGPRSSASTAPSWSRCPRAPCRTCPA